MRNIYLAVALTIVSDLAMANVLSSYTLTIVREDQSQVYFMVEVAADLATRSRGLMERPKLPKRTGMLFDFKQQTTVRMWMKNTLIPLDMLFATERGVIVFIKDNAVPGSQALIGPNHSVRYVLELNGGEAGYYDIRPGDRILTDGER